MQDLVINFRDDGSHLYEQIYQHIKEEIRKGKLLCHEKLPSTRSLAEYLQVSRSTVETAYGQLLSEGYIESIPYRGYFVAKVEELYQLQDDFPEKRTREGNEKIRFQIDFSPNAIDMRYFPFGVWRRINKNTLSQDKKETFSLGEAKGDQNLRETIARYLHASRGVNCTPGQIIVGAGNDYLLLLLRYVLGEHCNVAFENPTYPRAYKIFRMFAGRLVTVRSDEAGIRVDQLEQCDADVVYVMPTHQYPTGVVMPIGRRLELLKWAMEKPERYIIEDDYDSEFRYKGKPVPSLQASDTAEKVIYIGTFSKSIAPAIRVSFMVLPQKLLHRYDSQFAVFSSTVSRIDQAVLDEFIRDGFFERHLNRMRKIYKEKHDFLLDGLKPFLKDFTLSGEHAGLHILLTDKRGRNEALLREAAAEAGVRVYGISEAMVETENVESEQETERVSDLPAVVMLGFGGLTKEEISEGLSLLKKAWNIP
ncbi:MAG: PLP-dependent aminotransferase family protein [Lachnospiraceae bacterium]|nr:PLP-dependent aminotransferase family protein [Lachnospiraceae bacterium]